MVGVVALLWTIWILAFQPKNATYHVRRVMSAYLNGDSRTLVRYQIDEEAKLMPLTAKQIHQMNEEIVFPVLREYADGKSITIDGQDKMKLGTVRLRNKQGRTAEFGMNVYSHNNDHKIFVTQAVSVPGLPGTA